MSDRGYARAAIVLVVLATIAGVVTGTMSHTLTVREREAAARWTPVQDAYRERNFIGQRLVGSVHSQALHSGFALAERYVFRLVPDIYTLPNLLLSTSELGDAPRFRCFVVTQRWYAANMERVLAIADRYPSLMRKPEFVTMRQAFERAQSAVMRTRRAYDAAVEAFDARWRRFPDRLVGRYDHLTPKLSFAANADIETLPLATALRVCPGYDPDRLASDEALYVQWQRVVEGFQRRNRLMLELAGRVVAMASPASVAGYRRLLGQLNVLSTRVREPIPYTDLGDAAAFRCFVIAQQEFRRGADRMLAAATSVPNLARDGVFVAKQQRLRRITQDLVFQQARFDALVGRGGPTPVTEPTTVFAPHVVRPHQFRGIKPNEDAGCNNLKLNR